MQKIKELLVLHNNLPGHDKVYVVVLTCDVSVLPQAWRCVTIYGPRTGTRPLVTSNPAPTQFRSTAALEFNTTVAAKKAKGYKTVYHLDSGFQKVVDAIKLIDPEWFLLGQIEQGNQQQPVPHAQIPASPPPNKVASGEAASKAWQTRRENARKSRSQQPAEVPPPIPERGRRELDL